MKLYIDIETAPNDLINPKLIKSLRDNMRPDMRMKDAEKSKQEKFDKLMDEAALNPLLNKIILIGVATNEDSIVSFCAPTELETLQQFARYTDSLPFSDHIVTFNGYSFDLPVIKIRCAVNQVSVRLQNLDLEKYSESNRDLRLLLTNYDKFAVGTLEQWAFLFGYDGESSTISGADIPQLYAEGKIDIIREKNINDIKLLRFLDQKMSLTM